MNKKLLVLLPAVLFVVACSTANDVEMNSDYQIAVAMSEKARMEAIAEIAQSIEAGNKEETVQ